jgi:hypothetical protein
MTALRILSQVITADPTRVFAVVALIKRLADKGQKNNSAYAELFFYADWPMRIYFFTGGRAGDTLTRREFVFVGGLC